jgi:hypothetical protein
MQKINPNDYQYLMGRYDTRLPSGESIMIVQVNNDGSASFRYLDGEKKDETGTCDVRTITIDQ